jgi:hypothetical protein
MAWLRSRSIAGNLTPWRSHAQPSIAGAEAWPTTTRFGHSALRRIFLAALGAFVVRLLLAAGFSVAECVVGALVAALAAALSSP